MPRPSQPPKAGIRIPVLARIFMTEPLFCMTVNSNKIKLCVFTCFMFFKSKPQYFPTCTMFRNNFCKMMHSPISVNFFGMRHVPVPVLNYAILKLSTESSLKTAFLA